MGDARAPAMELLHDFRQAFPVGSLLLALCSCGAGADEMTGTATGEIQDSELVCDAVGPGQGWLNQPMPDSQGVVTASWTSTPSDHSIDAVLGFSNGSAATFSDLGPIVRFGPLSNIEARNGSSYGGYGFPYTGGVGPFGFQLRIDVPAHRYSAWVRHLDSPYKAFELLARDFEFRTEQAGVTRLNNWGKFVDSSAGTVRSCYFEVNSATGCVQSFAGNWQSRPFTTLGSSLVDLTFYAWVSQPNVDAVVGAASGAPSSFSQLATIVRFRPDGRIDARNGSDYAADVDLTYSPNSYYAIEMLIDLTRGTYSVDIAQPEQGSRVALANDYAFRTEQQGVTSLDHLAQFVDGTPGELNSCALVSR